MDEFHSLISKRLHSSEEVGSALHSISRRLLAAISSLRVSGENRQETLVEEQADYGLSFSYGTRLFRNHLCGFLASVEACVV